MKRLLYLTLACWFFAAAPLLAQQEEILQARTLSSHGATAQIDQGRESHVEPGDLVWFRPLGSEQVRGVVQTVQARTAWVLLQGQETNLPTGTPAEVSITRPQGAKETPDAWLRDPNSALPTTPPVWQSDPFPYDPEAPLLTDIPQTEEPSTPSTWSGQTYLLFDVIRDRNSASRTSTFGRAGADFYGEDVGSPEGSMRLSFDMDIRSFSGDGSSERDTHLRLERLSYAHRLSRDHPTHWQVGRFLPSEFPEFGVLDGAEFVYRRSDGHRFGSSVGYLPQPGQEYRTGEDLQVAATYQGMLGEERQFRWGLGFQKSWHEGTPDRDLAILKAHYLPSAKFSWTNSAWVDFYNSSDTSKSSGPEISLWTSYLYWNQGSSGSSLGFRHWRLPQTLRFRKSDSIFLAPIEARTSRVDASSWVRLGSRMRLNGQANYWKSESRSGTGGDVRIDFETPFGPGSRGWAGFFAQEGGDNDVGGLRLGQSITLQSHHLRLSWEGARYRPTDEDGTLFQRDLRFGWDYRSTSNWMLSLDFGMRRGDEQDTLSAGLYLQRSF